MVNLPYYNYYYPITAERQFHGAPFQYMPIHLNPIIPNQFSNRPNNMNNPYQWGLHANSQTQPMDPLPIQTVLDDPLYPIYNLNSFQPPSAFMQSQLLGLPFTDEPPRPNGSSGLTEFFKGKDGNVDYNKMISTAGQLMGTLNQFTGLLKGVTSMFKV